jgi:Family of unknown function (DUF6508)
VSERDRLLRLGAFLEEFRDGEFSFGHWDKIGFCRSEAARRFVNHCNEDGWVIGFDWPAWKGTPEAQRFVEPDAILAHANTSDLEKLLTVAIRQDRFVEGGLNGWFEAGLLTAIMQRARALGEALT